MFERARRAGWVWATSLLLGLAVQGTAGAEAYNPEAVEEGDAQPDDGGTGADGQSPQDADEAAEATAEEVPPTEGAAPDPAAAEQPAPTGQATASEDSAAKEPATEEPTAEEPTAEEPATEEPAAEDASTAEEPPPSSGPAAGEAPAATADPTPASTSPAPEPAPDPAVAEEPEYVPGQVEVEGKLTPSEMARRSETAFGTNCSSRSPAEVKSNPPVLAAASNAWAELTDYYDNVEKRPYLMYWRGMLAYCVDRPAEAEHDLVGFLKLEGHNKLYASLTAEAVTVLKILKVAIPELQGGGAVGDDTSSDTRQPSEVATTAYSVHNENCADLQTSVAHMSAPALASVSEAWQEVEDSYQAYKEPYLLYWRGLLTLCIGNTAQGIADLQQFVGSETDRVAYGSMIKDAKRRLRIAERAGVKVEKASTVSMSTDLRQRRARKVAAPGVVLGTLMLAGGAASGVVGALHWQQTNQVREDLYYPEPLSAADLESWIEDGRRYAHNGNLLVGIGGGLVVGSLIPYIIAGAAGARVRKGLVQFHVAPGPDGPWLGVSAPW